ncbi:MAG: metal-dependent hydrolase [Acidobacteriota bacterium]
MPSAFSHAVAAVALGRSYTTKPLPKRFWILSALCAVAPDMDVMGKRFGIEYTDLLGHRGFTHSIIFALVLSALIVLIFFSKPIANISRKMIFILFFTATISHGILDAMVDGTLGVAFLAPFANTRFFLPFRPIVSSPVGWSFFSLAGAMTLMNEFVWVWMPSIIVIFAPYFRKRLLNKSEAPSTSAT